MIPLERITFVVPVKTTGEVLQKNFLTSACFSPGHDHQILIQEGFESAARAYNDAIDKSQTDLIVFVHQDVFLPESWLSDLHVALECLELSDPNWGILGCYGETPSRPGTGYLYSSGLGILGGPFDCPKPVQTLDEVLLVLRKSSGLRFDDDLPHFHLHGADICLNSIKQRRNNYAISAFCIHNTNEYFILPSEFYECYWYLKRKWKRYLPIQTSCISITSSNFPLWQRRLREFFLRYLHQKQANGNRTQDIRKLRQEVELLRNG